MNKQLLQAAFISCAIALTTSCASTSDLEATQAAVAQAQKTADEAKAAAAKAQKSADDAMKMAAAAQQSADAANATAAEAKQTSIDAKQSAEDANTKINRSFKKAMYK